MSYSRIKIWIAAEVLTSSDLNAEFSGNITNENDLDTRLIAEIAARSALEESSATTTYVDDRVTDYSINNVVEDTTPELGGEMDAGAHSIGFTQQAITSAWGVTINWKRGNKAKITLGHSVTFTFTAPSNPCNLVLAMVQNGDGGKTVTWPATVKWADSTQPTWNTGANKLNLATFYYDGTNYWGAGGVNFG